MKWIVLYLVVVCIVIAVIAGSKISELQYHHDILENKVIAIQAYMEDANKDVLYDWEIQ